MSTTEGLAARAENLLIQLNHVLSESKKADDSSRIETARARAEQSRKALESVTSVLPELRGAGVTAPKLPESRVKDLADARRILRATATTVASVGTAEAAQRVSAESVNRALESAEKTGSWLLTQLNRAAERARQELQPANLDERIVGYPNVPDSVVIKLRRIQATLQTPISSTATAEQLVTRISDLREGVQYWNAQRPLLDQAKQSQHEDVRHFLTLAATEEGAPWSAITDVVRDWLSDADNADTIRLHLG